MEYITLRNGVNVPIIGYGVNKVVKGECERCVLDALKAGYRLIDTAQAYFNEEEIGSAIKKSGIPREEIMISTKIGIENYGYEACRESVLEDLEKFGTDYIDICLVHQPFGDYYGAYRALEDLYKEGKIRAIGVSNFYADRVVDIASFARIKPMINQCEIHPYNQQIESKKWHDKYGVQMMAWAPFGQGRAHILELPEIERIARRYGKSIAQVILRWNIQRGIIAIPKTSDFERMKENIDVFGFRLHEDDMERMERIDEATSLFFSHYDPRTVEWFAQKVEERKDM